MDSEMHDREQSGELETVKEDRDRGFSIIVVLLVMVLLSALGLTLMFTTETERAISRNFTSSIQATYSSEAGIQAALQGFTYDMINDMKGQWANRWLVIPEPKNAAPNCGGGVTSDVCVDSDGAITGLAGQHVVNLDPWTESDPADDATAGFPSLAEWPPAAQRADFETKLKPYVPWMFADTGSGKYFISLRSIARDEVSPMTYLNNELGIISEGIAGLKVKTNLSHEDPVESTRKIETRILGANESQWGKALVGGAGTSGQNEVVKGVYRIHGDVLHFNDDTTKTVMSFQEDDSGIFNTFTPYSLGGHSYPGIDSFWLGESQIGREADCGAGPPGANIDCVFSQNHIKPPPDLWADPDKKRETLKVTVRVKAGKVALNSGGYAYMGVPEGAENPSESHFNPIASFLGNVAWEPNDAHLNAGRVGPFDFTDPNFKFVDLYDVHKTKYHVYENYMHYIHNDVADDDKQTAGNDVETGWDGSDSYTQFQADRPGIWGMDLTGLGEGDDLSRTPQCKAPNCYDTNTCAVSQCVPDCEDPLQASPAWSSSQKEAIRDERSKRFFFLGATTVVSTMDPLDPRPLAKRNPPFYSSTADCNAFNDLPATQLWKKRSDPKWVDIRNKIEDSFKTTGGLILDTANGSGTKGWSELNTAVTVSDSYGIHFDNRGTAKQSGLAGAGAKGDPWGSMAAALLVDILKPRMGRCWDEKRGATNDDCTTDWDPEQSELFVNNILNAPAMYRDAGLRLRVLIHLDGLKSMQDLLPAADMPYVTANDTCINPTDGTKCFQSRSYRADRWVGAEMTRDWKGELKFFNRPWDPDDTTCKAGDSYPDPSSYTCATDDDPMNDLMGWDRDYQVFQPGGRRYLNYNKWIEVTDQLNTKDQATCEALDDDPDLSACTTTAVNDPGACYWTPVHVLIPVADQSKCWCRILYQPDTKINQESPPAAKSGYDSRFWFYTKENEPTGFFALMLFVPGDDPNDASDGLDKSPIKRPSWYANDIYVAPGYDYRKNGDQADRYSPYGATHTLVWAPRDFRVSTQRSAYSGPGDATDSTATGWSEPAAAPGEPMTLRVPFRDRLRSCPVYAKNVNSTCFTFYGSRDTTPWSNPIPHHGGTENPDISYFINETNFRIPKLIENINPNLGGEWFLGFPLIGSSYGYYSVPFIGPHTVDTDGSPALRYDGFKEILGSRSTSVPAYTMTVPTNKPIGGYAVLRANGVILTKSGGISFGAKDKTYTNLIGTDGRFILVSFDGTDGTRSDGTTEDNDGTDDNPNGTPSGDAWFFDSVVPIGRYGCEDFSSTIAYKDTHIYNVNAEKSRIAMYSISEEDLLVNPGDLTNCTNCDADGASLAGSWLAGFADFGPKSTSGNMTELIGLGYDIKAGSGCDSEFLPGADSPSVTIKSFTEQQY